MLSERLLTVWKRLRSTDDCDWAHRPDDGDAHGRRNQYRDVGGTPLRLLVSVPNPRHCPRSPSCHRASVPSTARSRGTLWTSSAVEIIPSG